MRVSYSAIAGRGLERLAALSDGVFAIVMTLLILEIHVPELAEGATEGALWAGLLELAPRFLTYLLSFLTLGIFWVGQQTQFNHFERADRDLTWIHIAFLAFVAIMPFTTSLLAEHIELRLALVIYWAQIFVLGAILYSAWVYAQGTGLLRADVKPDVGQAIKRRILVAQALYAIGALLAVLTTYASIAFIVLVQLNFAIGPRIRWLSRV